MPRPSRKTALLIASVIAIIIVMGAAVSIWSSTFYNSRFPSIGSIRTIGVEVYGGDMKLDESGLSYIDWDTVYPGLPVNRSFAVRSSSNINITLENIAPENLTFYDSEGNNVTESLPDAVRNPVGLSWNYTGAPLRPREEIYVVVTLQLSSADAFIRYLVDYDVEGFSFDMVVRPLNKQS